MTPVHQIGFTDVLVLAAGVWVVSKIVKRLASHSKHGTKLNGPPRESYFFGVSRALSRSTEPAARFEGWASTYGAVYELPTALGGRRIVLTDPKAVNHFYSSERSVYVKTTMTRTVIANTFGRGLLWAEGEDHKRQRKGLTPAFSNAAIRRLTDVFYDSAHKLKGHWDTTLENAKDGEIIDVEYWMNHVALDSIGIAGFSHDFRSLDGEYSSVAAAFDALAFQGDSFLTILVFMLGQQLPFLANLPSRRNRVLGNLRKTLNDIAGQLLERTRREKENYITDEKGDRSIIGLLLKAEEEGAELYLTQQEIVAQNVLLVAGYETTSISLTWALIELARNPEMQNKLREELVKFGPNDATWDQLTGSALPYLDAVVLETLRIHPALPDTVRQAQVDDVIPLSEPITTKSGELVNSIAVAKGSIVAVSIRCMNLSTAMWGSNAKKFVPERWLTLDDDTLRAKEIQGHRHLITFLDGPRTCLGKQFAIAEFKAVLSTLVKNFTFEFPDGPETEIGKRRGLIQRPTIPGLTGASIPLRVRRVD